MAKPELRVLQVLSNLGTGGAEKWVIALLRHFRDASDDLPFRIKSDVFLTHGRRSSLDAQAETLGATLHYSRYSRTTLGSFVRDWRHALRKGKYHALHDHQEFSAGIHFLMGINCLPPVRIAHVHNPLTHLQNYSSDPLRKLTVRAGNRLIARLATHVLGTSRQLIAEQGFFSTAFSRVIREPVHCGFDVTQFSGNHPEHFKSMCCEFGFPTDCRIILFVGRLDSHPEEHLSQKNPAFALEVARACAQRNSRIRFLMAGGGETVRHKLENRVEQWGLGERLRLLGNREDVPRLMLGSHLFMLPSIAEGLGMVVVEAQAAGLCSLVSSVVPAECVVVPSMVRFKSLDDGAAAWADSALEMVSQVRPMWAFANSQVRRSPFSIENSAARLIQIYSSSNGSSRVKSEDSQCGDGS